MAKVTKTQKKKTASRTILNNLFKGLVGVAVIIFIYVLYDNVSFGTGGISFTPKKKGRTVNHTPSDLKWFDDFKGVENVRDKNKKKNSGGGTGFKYEGF